MASIAKIVANMDSCPPGVVVHLKAEQLHDLHHFKHRLVASLHRVYTRVPEEEADAILGRLLKEIVDKLDQG